MKYFLLILIPILSHSQTNLTLNSSFESREGGGGDIEFIKTLQDEEYKTPLSALPSQDISLKQQAEELFNNGGNLLNCKIEVSFRYGDNGLPQAINYTVTTVKSQKNFIANISYPENGSESVKNDIALNLFKTRFVKKSFKKAYKVLKKNFQDGSCD